MRFHLAPKSTSEDSSNELQDLVRAELRKQRKLGKQPEVVLPPLDTTIPPYSGDKSSALSNIAESAGSSFSASRSRLGRKGPRDLQVPQSAHQQFQPSKPLPDPPQKRSPRHYINSLLPSPLFGMQPPLSARSAAFLISVQHMLSSTVETYLRRYDGSMRTPRSHHDKESSESMLEAQSVPSFSSGLSLWRKLLLSFCIMGTVTILVLAVVFVRVDRMGTGRASHWLMGTSGAIVFLAAGAMFAVQRPLSEILVMVVVGVLICQCVMDDIHSGKG